MIKNFNKNSYKSISMFIIGVITFFYLIGIANAGTWNETFEEGLLSIYQLEESSGTNVQDSFTYSLDGTLVGSRVTLGATGINGSGYENTNAPTTSSSQGDGINISMHYENFLEGLTVSYWYKPDSTQNGENAFNSHHLSQDGTG